MEWLKDEMNLRGAEEFHQLIISLFEKALSDYHYRKVYKMYLRYLIEAKIPDQGAVFERALRVHGLDLEKGNAIWELYAKYSEGDE